MNSPAGSRLAWRLVVIVLLAVASYAALHHGAEHLGKDLNCPVCLQVHAGGPALLWQVLPLVPPLVGQHLHNDVAQSFTSVHPLQIHTGRAPPASRI